MRLRIFNGRETVDEPIMDTMHRYVVGTIVGVGIAFGIAYGGIWGLSRLALAAGTELPNGRSISQFRSVAVGTTSAEALRILGAPWHSEARIRVERELEEIATGARRVDVDRLVAWKDMDVLYLRDAPSPPSDYQPPAGWKLASQRVETDVAWVYSRPHGGNGSHHMLSLTFDANDKVAGVHDSIWWD